MLGRDFKGPHWGLSSGGRCCNQNRNRGVSLGGSQFNICAQTGPGPVRNTPRRLVGLLTTMLTVARAMVCVAQGSGSQAPVVRLPDFPPGHLLRLRHCGPSATSRGRYFKPQSGATTIFFASTYGSARRMRSATIAGVSTVSSARSKTPSSQYCFSNWSGA
jgi:hypothetical protein